MASEQLDALIDGPREIKLNSGKSITIRPFTFGSFGLSKKLGLTMFVGEDERFDENGQPVEDPARDLDDDTIWQLQAFFWMQSQPVNEVLGAVRNGSWRDRVEEFGFDLPLHVMHDLMAEMNRINKMAAEAAVDVVPRDDSDADSGAPGN